MSMMFQNDNYLKEGDDGPFGEGDWAAYRRELDLAKLAEPLGFNSLWSVEHHFTGYTMVSDVLQFLAYMAGQTTHIRLGSGVVVLPWNNPARVADAVAMLDNLSGGRFVFGIGRGLGRIEFEGFGVPMDESRSRFTEAAELILTGLERGYIEYAGQHYEQPKRWIRPAPVRSFRGRTYASAVSPESLDIIAALGVGLMIVPQKPWDTIAAEVQTYRERYEAVNGTPAPEPIVVNQVFCDSDSVRAGELGQQYIGDYFSAVMKHYELAGGHFANTKGYEYYQRSAAQLQKHSPELAQSWYADLQCYGSPDECVDRVAYIKERIGCAEFVGTFSFGGMPGDEAERNMRLFAKEVLPRLKSFGLQSRRVPSSNASFPAAF